MSSSLDKPDKLPLEALAGFARPGDYVVPSYSLNGKKEESGTVMGNSKQAELIKNHAARVKGGSFNPDILTNKPVAVVDGPKSKKKIKVATVAPIQETFDNNVYQAPEPELNIDVMFTTEFGTITLSACGLMETELAIGLIFKNDKEMRFIPRMGSKLKVTISSKEIDIYYPGIVFTMPDHVKKLMILLMDKE